MLWLFKNETYSQFLLQKINLMFLVEKVKKPQLRKKHAQQHSDNWKTRWSRTKNKSAKSVEQKLCLCREPQNMLSNMQRTKKPIWSRPKNKIAKKCGARTLAYVNFSFSGNRIEFTAVKKKKTCSATCRELKHEVEQGEKLKCKKGWCKKSGFCQR